MNELSLLYNYLMVGAILFVLGLVGFLTRRNLIVMFLCAEMMLQGVSLTLIGFGRFHQDFGGQMLVIFIIRIRAIAMPASQAATVMMKITSICPPKSW